jgi:ligand-binding SRPBCC domain-containing protein
MPRFETAANFPFPVGRVFAYLLRPANRVALAPPQLQLRLIEGPEVLVVGARVTVQGRRWGLSRRLVSEVTALEADASIVEEQREGPFRAWRHAQRFEALPDGGARLLDAIDYEPPGGMLGLLLSAGAVECELAGAFAHRDRRLRELLAAGG